MVRVVEYGRDDTHEPHRVRFYVETEEYGVVGSCVLDFLSRQDGVPQIWEVMVFEEFRRKGYGKELIQAVVDYARCNHIPKIALHVYLKNRPALRVYDSVGFFVETVWGELQTMVCETGVSK